MNLHDQNSQYVHLYTTSPFSINNKQKDYLLDIISYRNLISPSQIVIVNIKSTSQQRIIESNSQQKVKRKITHSKMNFFKLFQLLIIISINIKITQSGGLFAKIITDSSNKHGAQINVLKMSQDYSTIVSAGLNGYIKIWRLNTTTLIQTFIQVLTIPGTIDWYCAQSIFIWNNGSRIFLMNSSKVNVYQFNLTSQLYIPHSQTPSIGAVYINSISVNNNGSVIYVGHTGTISIFQWIGANWVAVSMPSLVNQFTGSVNSIAITNNEQKLVAYGSTASDRNIKIFLWNGTSFVIDQTIISKYSTSFQNCKLSKSENFVSCYGNDATKKGQYHNYKLNSSNKFYEVSKSADITTNVYTFDSIMDDLSIYTILEDVSDGLYRYKFQIINGTVSYTLIDSYTFPTLPRRMVSDVQSKFQIVGDNDGHIHLIIYCEDGYIMGNNTCVCLSPKKQLTGVCDLSFNQANMTNCMIAERTSNITVICKQCNSSLNEMLFNGACVCDTVNYLPSLNASIKGCVCASPYRLITGVCDLFNQTNMKNCLVANRTSNTSVICTQCNSSINQILVNGVCICQVNYSPSLNVSIKGCTCELPYRIITGVCDLFNQANMTNCMVAERTSNTTVICKQCNSSLNEMLFNDACVCDKVNYSPSLNVSVKGCVCASPYRLITGVCDLFNQTNMTNCMIAERISNTTVICKQCNSSINEMLLNNVCVCDKVNYSPSLNVSIKGCVCASPFRLITGVCDLFNETNMTNCLVAERSSNTTVICKQCNSSIDQIVYNDVCVCDIINFTPSTNINITGCVCALPYQLLTGVCDSFNQANMTNCMIAQRTSNTTVICKKCDPLLNQMLLNGVCVCNKINFTPSLIISIKGCLCQSPYRLITGVCDYFNQTHWNNCLVAERILNTSNVICKYCSSSAHEIVSNGICVCQPGYSFSNITNKCAQICGDGKIYSKQCDDNNTSSGDGCSSQCNIQSGFQCDNQQPSYCKSLIELLYSQKIISDRSGSDNMGQLKIKLSSSMANIPFSILKQNFIPVNQKIRFFIIVNQSTSEQIQIKNLQILFVDNDNTLVIKFPYEFTIQSMKGKIFLNYQNTRYANTTQQIKFLIKGETSPVIFNSDLQSLKKLSYINLVQIILSLIILFVGMFTAKFIGVEMATILQLIYFSQVLIADSAKWPVAFLLLKNFKIVTGISDLIAFSSYSSNQNQAIKFKNLEIKKMIIQNFNVIFGLLILSFLVLFVFFIIENISANKLSRLIDERKQQGIKTQQSQIKIKLYYQKHKFKTNLNQKSFFSATNFAFCSILPFIVAMSAFLFIDKEQVTINKDQMPTSYQNLNYVQKAICFSTLMIIFVVGLNYFQGLLINKAITRHISSKKEQLIYKRSLFIYLVILGSFIMFFNDKQFVGLPTSVYVLVFQSLFIVFLIIIKPYKRSLRIHTATLFINNVVYLVFLLIINFINFIDNISQMLIVCSGYFLTICCGCLAVLSAIRIYYQYRYGEELQAKIIKQQQEIIQKQKKKKQQLLKLRKLKLEAQKKQNLYQRQKALNKNYYFHQNQIRQIQKQDMIQWLEKMNWNEQQKQKYFFKNFQQKPLSWLERNNQKQYQKAMQEQNLQRQKSLKKKQTNKNDSQYTKQINRLKVDFQRNVQQISKKLQKHQKMIKQQKAQKQKQTSFKQLNQTRYKLLTNIPIENVVINCEQFD